MISSPRMPEIIQTSSGEVGVELELRIPQDLFWFQGHFPDLSVLPGVVQVDWALALARKHFDLPVAVARQLKVKFVSPIRPGDRLTLQLAHRKGRLSFEYRRDDLICSSGQVPIG